MITAPESSITLTDEQTAAIERSKIVLGNLEAEATIAQKSLNILKKENIKVQEEKKDNEDALSSLKEAISSKQQELSVVSTQLSDALHSLAKTREETELLSKSLTKKESDLNAREEALNTREEDLTRGSKQLSEGLTALETDKDTVTKAKNALVAACELITWKYSKEQ